MKDKRKWPGFGLGGEQLSIPPLGFILVNKFSATSISHATDPHFTTPAQADSKSLENRPRV